MIGLNCRLYKDWLMTLWRYLRVSLHPLHFVLVEILRIMVLLTLTAYNLTLVSLWAKV